MGFLMKLMKLSGVTEYWMGFSEIEWSCNGVGQKPAGSMGFTFNGAVTVYFYPS